MRRSTVPSLPLQLVFPAGTGTITLAFSVLISVIKRKKFYRMNTWSVSPPLREDGHLMEINLK
jgi:hypothetical protein